jgi:hypothetical protein
MISFEVIVAFAARTRILKYFHVRNLQTFQLIGRKVEVVPVVTAILQK